MVREQVAIYTINKHNYLFYNQPKECYKANEEHKRAHQAKDMHWLLTKVGEKPEGQ